jgi:folate-dependent phosphoribosylglycinamide formyltransferase PurN
MKIVLITGSHPRHKFLARKLAETGILSLIISQKRESFVPNIPNDLDNSLGILYLRHFDNRVKSEQQFFGQSVWPNVTLFKTGKAQKNSPEVLEIIEGAKPNLLISYGCGILSDEILTAVKGEAWNIHGGLSPWYKGGITMFWPSYMLEPQMTGMTIHDLTSNLDAGDVIHQCTADLVRGDGIHDLACRAVVKAGSEIIELVRMLSSGQEIKKKKQQSNGKLWIGRDWRPEHLKMIYEVYGDRIVDHYLDGKFKKRKPDLHRQF